MSSLGHASDNKPRDDSAQIRAHMEARGAKPLRVFLTLAGAAAGTYVAFSTSQGIVYVGIVAGLYGFYKTWPLLMRLGRHWQAKEYEIVQHDGK